MSARPSQTSDPPPLFPDDDEREILDRMSDGVAIFDREGRYLYLNAAGERLARLGREALLGRVIWEVYPGTEGNPLHQAFERVLAVGGRESLPPYHYAEWDRWYEAELFRVNAGVCGLWRDVTERVRADAERSERDRLRELFVGVLGHDLRTPLSAVRLSAYALARETDNAGHAKAATRIMRSVDRMEALVADLLDVTRVRLGGGLTLAPRTTDVTELCQRVLGELEAAHPGRVSLEAPEAVAAELDPSRFGQALVNLVANALEHGDGGAVVVALERRGRALALEVRNGGAPIPAALLPAIFDPFRRAAHGGQGLGLGLFIVREIARAHGGEVAVTSTEEGTRFSVSVPVVAGGGLGIDAPDASG